MISYLSPSSYSLFKSDREEFVRRYLLEPRVPREAPTLAMVIGSAFDAFAKSWIHQRLFGVGADPRYDLDTLFESQVECHRDEAYKAGKFLFGEYMRCGALGDLMLELSTAVNKPRFEFKINDTIKLDGAMVPLLGVPDIFFINDRSARVVFDWKVNGYCSFSPTSPMKGYVRCRSSTGGGVTQHKSAMVLSYMGVNINSAMNLEDGNREWAEQLAIYSWLLGEPIGSTEGVVGIDQIVGRPGVGPGLRFASHRLRMGAEFQYDLYRDLVRVWGLVSSGHIFDDMSREDSDARIAMIEQAARVGKNAAFDSLL